MASVVNDRPTELCRFGKKLSENSFDICLLPVLQQFGANFQASLVFDLLAKTQIIHDDLVLFDPIQSIRVGTHDCSSSSSLGPVLSRNRGRDAVKLTLMAVNQTS